MRWLFPACFPILLLAPFLSATAKPARAHAPAQECSAFTFKGLPAGAPSGRQEAGYFPTHFGRLAVTAEIRSGQVPDYELRLDGHALAPLAAPLPAGTVPCLKAKRLGVPGQTPETPCDGSRLKIVLMTDQHRQFILLYAMADRSWHFCQAAQAPD